MHKISNFHTHTMLCKHAEGLPIDYVNQAEKEGCVALGFSDHCPYPESFKDVWPNVRMSVEEIPFYIQSVELARQQASFPVFTGFECEWDKEYKGWYEDLIGKYGAQYLILGSHWFIDEGQHKDCRQIVDVKTLIKYVNNTIEGMGQGLFKFLAHPDFFMMGYQHFDEETKSCFKDIIQAAESFNIPLEINGLGTTRNLLDTPKGMRHPYPFAEFWEMVADSKAKVICNADAHNPKDVIFNAWKARDFAGRFGLTPIEILEI